jgi:hypothetical protein
MRLNKLTLLFLKLTNPMVRMSFTYPPNKTNWTNCAYPFRIMFPLLDDRMFETFIPQEGVLKGKEFRV